MMPIRQSGLGRGLGAIIPPKAPTPAPTPMQAPASASSPTSAYTPTTADASTASAFPTTTSSAVSTTVEEPEGGAISSQHAVRLVPLEQVKRNPFQPRTHFSHQELEDLIATIREHGLLQPLVVTPAGADGKYELIAGERRFRALSILGETHVPVIVRKVTEQQQLELAIIENTQRQDLNALEEAAAYARLADEFSLTQEQIADKVGKSRSQVANTIRLLMLPKEIREALMEGKISASNARTLLSLTTDAERLKLFHQMLNGGMTVRETEDEVSGRRSGPAIKDPNITDLEYRLRDQLHCRVEIKKNARGAGEIKLKFMSEDELKRLSSVLEQTQ